MSHPSAPGPGRPWQQPGQNAYGSGAAGFPGRGAGGFPGRGGQPEAPRPAPRGPVGPPGGSGRGGGGGGGRAPRSGGGRSVRLDPVVVEAVVGLVWLAVGTVGLGADGAGTILLALGIAAVAYVLVQNRRLGPGVFDAARSSELLRLGLGVIGILVVASILLGLVGFADLLPGLAAVLTGGAFALLARSTGQKYTRYLGIAVIVLGLVSAFASTQEANTETGGFVSQGLVGLLVGLLLVLSAADRVGLLSMLRDRFR